MLTSCGGEAPNLEGRFRSDGGRVEDGVSTGFGTVVEGRGKELVGEDAWRKRRRVED